MPHESRAFSSKLPVDLAAVPRQSFSESVLKQDGALYTVDGDVKPFDGHEVHLWEQYQKFRKMYADYGEDASEQAKAIGTRIYQVRSSPLGMFTTRTMNPNAASRICCLLTAVCSMRS